MTEKQLQSKISSFLKIMKNSKGKYCIYKDFVQNVTEILHMNCRVDNQIFVSIMRKCMFLQKFIEKEVCNGG